LDFVFIAKRFFLKKIGLEFCARREHTNYRTMDNQETVSAVLTAAQVASLQKDLDIEKKRTERLDQLLLTNANLRKKLQDDLHSTRQRCDALSVEVEGLRGTTSVDVAKAVAEAATFKQLYFKSLEEISQLRQQFQEQETLAASAADERDVLQRKLVFQEEQLYQFSPLRGTSRNSLPSGSSPRGLHADVVPTTVDIISEIIVDEEKRTVSSGGAFGESDHVQPWLLGPPDEVALNPDAEMQDHDGVVRRSAGIEGPERLDALEVQRIVVGLYRRLKASETVLGEVHQSRTALAERNAQLQSENEHLQRLVGAGRSPYGLRRDGGGVAVSNAWQRGKAPVMRPVSAPRRVSPYEVSRGVTSSANVSRPVSASRRPVSSGPRFVSPSGPTPPPSTIASARSFSGQSAVSAARGPAAVAAMASKQQQQHGSLYPYQSTTIVPSARTKSPLLFQVRQEAARQQQQLQQQHSGARPLSPALRKTLPVPNGVVLGFAQRSASDLAPASTVLHRVDPPPRLAFGRPAAQAAAAGGLTDEPPVMVRRTQALK
jgi:hypothetical protein